MADLDVLTVRLPVLVYCEVWTDKGINERLKGCYPRVLRRVRIDKEFINRRAELIPPLVKRMRDPVRGLR